MEIKVSNTNNGKLQERVAKKDYSEIFTRPKLEARSIYTAPVPPAETIQVADEKETKDKTFIVKVLNKIIGLAVFAIFFGLPLFFTGLTFQGVVFDKQLYFYFWLLLGLVSWTAKGVILGEMDIRRTPLDIPIIGFWLVYMLATIFSVDRWHSFWGSFGDPSRGFMNITALVIAYYFIFSNFSKKRLNLIFAAIVGSGAILIFWTFLGIRGIKFLPDSLAQYSPLSLIGSVSGLGIFFSSFVLILTAVILKVADNENFNKILKRILIGFLLLLLILDILLISALYSFVSWLGLFCGVAVFLIFILAKIVRPRLSWTWLPMAIFIIAMVARMVGEVSISKVNLPIEVTPNYQTSWDIAVSSLKNKFLLGSGPSTYGYDFSINRPQDFNLNAYYNLRFFQGTGILLEALPTVGAIGAFFLIIAVLSFLSLEFYLLAKEKEKNKLLSLGLFTASLIMLIDIFIARAEGSVLIFAALLAIVSLAMVLYESGVEEKYLSLSLKASPKYALALAFLFMVVSAGVAFLFVFIGKIYVGDVYAGAADREINTNQEDSILKMSKAINLYSKESRYYGQLGQYYMILANKEAVKGEKERDLQKIQQFLNYSIAATRQSGDLAKNDINSVEVLAQIYENAGLYVSDSLNLASDAYKRGLELDPHNPIYYLKLGQIKISLASTKKDDQERKQLISEADDLFQKSVSEKSNFDAGYYQLSLTQSALGNMDKAIEDGTKAVEINPQSEDYLVSLARLFTTRAKDDDLKSAEAIWKALIARNDNDITAHFYLGMLYEKNKNKDGAKQEYQKVESLLTGDGSAETKAQIEKMISNLDRGIENTPESMGLTTSAGNQSGNTGSGNGSDQNVQP